MRIHWLQDKSDIPWTLVHKTRKVSDKCIQKHRNLNRVYSTKLFYSLYHNGPDFESWASLLIGLNITVKKDFTSERWIVSDLDLDMQISQAFSSYFPSISFFFSFLVIFLNQKLNPSIPPSHKNNFCTFCLCNNTSFSWPERYSLGLVHIIFLYACWYKKWWTINRIFFSRSNFAFFNNNFIVNISAWF